MPQPRNLTGALYQPFAWPNGPKVKHDWTVIERDDCSSNEDTESEDDRDGKSLWQEGTSNAGGGSVYGPWEGPRTPDQRPRRSTLAAGLTQVRRSPIQTPRANDTNRHVGRFASKRPPGLSITTGRGRRRGFTLPVKIHAPNLDEIFSDSSPSPESPVRGFQDTQSDSEDEDWVHHQFGDLSQSRSPDFPRRDHWNAYDRGGHEEWHHGLRSDSDSSAAQSPQLPPSRSSDSSSNSDFDGVSGTSANKISRPMSLYPEPTLSELDLYRRRHGTLAGKLPLPRNPHPDPNSWEQVDSRQPRATTGNGGQSSRNVYPTPYSSEPNIFKQLNDTAPDQGIPRTHEYSPADAKLELSAQPSATEAGVGTPRDPDPVQRGSGLAGSTLIDHLAESHKSSPRGSEPGLSPQLAGGNSVDDQSSSPTSSWAAALGTPNSVVGDTFTGSFASPTRISPPAFEATRQPDIHSWGNVPVPSSSQNPARLFPRSMDQGAHTGPAISIQEERAGSQSSRKSRGLYTGPTDSSDTETVIRDPRADQEEQDPSHNKTRIALLDVHKRKQEVEQQLRRVQTEYKQALQDHAAKQNMSGRKYQDLVAQGEEREANHNDTRIALMKVHKEKYEAEQKLNRAVMEYRQKLQAVGIMAEDNAQPLWEVDLDGRQTRPLYKDFPNMTRESHVNLLLSRANCKFMLGDYQGMATIAFGALTVAERLHFKPLSARCHFIIGIAYYHNRRFDEAKYRFRLALDCKGKYGISTECVEGWLDKCSDGITGNPSADVHSPVRNRSPGDIDRVVDMRFRADVFFARATTVAGISEATDVESDEDVDGYTIHPSQDYGDKSDMTEEIPNSGVRGPKNISPEGGRSLTNLAGELGSMDFDSDEDLEDTEGELEHCLPQDSDGEDAETLDARTKVLLSEDDLGDRPSQDHKDQVMKIPDPRADGLGELTPEEERHLPAIDLSDFLARPSQEILRAGNAVVKPSGTVIPSIKRYNTTSDQFDQMEHFATVTAMAQPASRFRSSTFGNPMPLGSWNEPYSYMEEMPGKVRERAVTNAAHQAGKNSRPGRLNGPLSSLTKDMDKIPVKDMEAWVNRPLEERLQEAAKGQWQKRSPIAFMLYRSAYADRIRSLYKRADHKFISTVASESWKMEQLKIHEQYGVWAVLERENHEKAFPKTMLLR